MSEIKYEVQHYTLCNGWINCWTVIDENGNEMPQYFQTKADAEQELQEFFADIAHEIESGERSFEEGYSKDEFQIIEIVDD